MTHPYPSPDICVHCASFYTVRGVHKKDCPLFNPSPVEWDEDKKEWLDTFDSEYETLEQKALGIVARAMYHKQIAPQGADGSYITVKLTDIIEKVRQQEQEKIKFEETTYDEIKEVGRQEGIRAEKERILAALPDWKIGKVTLREIRKIITQSE